MSEKHRQTEPAVEGAAHMSEQIRQTGGAVEGTDHVSEQSTLDSKVY